LTVEIALEGIQFAPGLNRRERHLQKQIAEVLTGTRRRWLDRLISAMSGYSEEFTEKLLAHSWGKTSFTMPAEMFLALLTSVPTASSTGESVEATEATYTGYVRLKLDLTKFKLTKAATSTIKNELELTFAACTGLEKTVTAWATTTKKRAEACPINMWGTCSSTVISTTQTPPTVAAEKLVGELK
jgi:hypothetical protein